VRARTAVAGLLAAAGALGALGAGAAGGLGTVGAGAARVPETTPAAAAAPRVEVMVAGRTRVLRPATRVVARATTVRVGARRCAVAAGTPLAALAALRAPSFSLRDFGACSRRSPAASEGLFVQRIGGERNRGADGWVYKAGRRAPGLGAGALGARLRAGTRLLWFWCRQGRGGCQRSLEVTASPARVAPGAPLAFTVRGYDDRGRGVAVAGALVRFAGARLRTGPDGTVAAVAPGTAGRRRVSAQAPGLVPSFPQEVVVG
jgi:hypothetical protein